jgi:hypothetical protein
VVNERPQLAAPPFPVCLKGPVNIEKLAHELFFSFLLHFIFISILFILVNIKVRLNRR